MKRRRLVEVTSGALALGLTSGFASAALMTFDNTGWGFAWNHSVILPGAPTIPGQSLDVTMPASQSGAVTPFGLVYQTVSVTTSGELTPATIEAQSANVRIAGDGEEVVFVVGGGTFWRFIAARTYDVGESVGPGASWDPRATVGVFGGPVGGDVPIVGPSAVVGVRLTMSGATHYGWVWLQWDEVTPHFNRLQYRPTMWAYETEANTPALVTIPAPGASAAALVCGGVVGTRRRRG